MKSNSSFAFNDHSILLFTLLILNPVLILIDDSIFARFSVADGSINYTNCVQVVVVRAHSKWKEFVTRLLLLLLL